MSGKRIFLVVLAILAAVARLSGTGPSFHPDHSFQGSVITGWPTLGDATWHAANGEITGNPAQPAGGWLVLDHSYQDVGFYASFKCEGICKTRLLRRVEKTPQGGMKGVFVSLSEGDVASYALTLDAQGHELKRDKLRRGGGQMRIAPPVDPNAPVRPRTPGEHPGLPPGLILPVTPPDTSLRAGEWNTVETFLDANIDRSFLNT